MNRILKTMSLAVLLAGSPAAAFLASLPAQAQAADPAVEQIQISMTR